ncbi:lysylphosphatidylglycerol synthase transmembrane domain-containing protein [Marinimicrobium sp. C2-29]|uniref:lysylphosphatidylglycerol synthase transmembrane domain-containing protein n=1 Tax=Marinimicrobium sp. C2-29 TaxID=3139825 RepID=UPI0031391925
MASFDSIPTSTRRLALSGVLFVALTAVGLYIVYEQMAQQELAFDTRLLHPWVILAVLAMLGLYYGSDALRLHYTLKALGHHLPFASVLRLVFINLFFSNITPMATGGGFAQIWYLKRQGVHVGHATAATTIRTLLAVAFIFTLTPVCLLTLPALDGEVIGRDIGLALSLFIFLYLGFFAIVFFRTRWLIGPLSGLLSRLHRLHLISEQRHRRWQYKARREMLRFSTSFGLYWRGGARYVLLSIIFTGLFLLTMFSFPALLIVALGYSVDYLTTLGLLLVTTFVMYFSPTPGASGISEGLFGRFFRDILGGQHLLLVTVAWRLLTIYLGMIIGLLLFRRTLHEELLSAREHDKAS